MKKGFTLVELLAVIILLGLLGLIIYPTVNGVINNNKEKLHDKQIEELKRHAETYATYNMSELRTYDGARNFVTFEDLYKAGIIQSDKVVDPSNDEEMTGCMTLTWNDKRQSFDIAYDQKCITSVSISGKISGTNSANATIQLTANRNVIYESTTDENGNYSFNGVLPGKYVLLVSKRLHTKYGREVELYEDMTKDMTIELFKGDMDENDTINAYDRDFVSDCLGSFFLSTSLPKCYDDSKGLDRAFYDFNGDGDVNMNDRTPMINYANDHKSSNIVLLRSFNLSGKVKFEGTILPTVKLTNGVNEYNAVISNDGTFKFNDIPGGTYHLEISKLGHTSYNKFIYLDSDITGIRAEIYAGDVMYVGVIDENDVTRMNTAIANSYDPSEGAYQRFDLNDDDVIDSKDLAILQRNIGKEDIYE